MKIVVVLFLIFRTLEAHAEAIFQKGHAFIQGSLVKQIPTLSAKTIIVCDPTCVITQDDSQWTITFSGFGEMGSMFEMSEKIQKKTENTPASSQGGDSKEGESSPDAPETEQKGLGGESTKEQGYSLTKSENANSTIPLAVPYPKDQTVFLNKDGGLIYILPAQRCDEHCALFVSIDGKKTDLIDFKPGQLPLGTMNIMPTFQGMIQWNYQDGQKRLQQTFEVRPQTSENLSKALKENKPVEMMP